MNNLPQKYYNFLYDSYRWGMHFFKKALENESGRVPKQTFSQSAVRGVCTRDAKERALISVHSQKSLTPPLIESFNKNFHNPKRTKQNTKYKWQFVFKACSLRKAWHVYCSCTKKVVSQHIFFKFLLLGSIKQSQSYRFRTKLNSSFSRPHFWVTRPFNSQKQISISCFALVVTGYSTGVQQVQPALIQRQYG